MYLWQLKEYHIGRFIDHFRTHKGKKLLFNFEQIFKLAALAVLIITPEFFSFEFFIIFLIYFAELALFLRAIIK
jgi:hypothetical protein